MDYQSLVNFDYWTLIAQLCNFGIQLLLFKRFLFEPVKKILEKRQAELINRLFSAGERSGVNATRLVVRALQLHIIDLDNLKSDDE